MSNAETTGTTVSPGPAAFSLAGKTALVVGGATGIGFAVAESFIAAGARVYIAGRRRDVGADAAARLGATSLSMDVRDGATVDAAVATILEDVGRLDVAVNGAGTGLNKPTVETTDDEFDAVVQTNFGGVFRCCRAEARAMIAGGGGTIVNIASMSAHVVNHPQRQAIYNASKAAVVHYTRSLAVEWAADGIRVNSVSPGYTATALTAVSRSMPERLASWHERTPLARVAEPAEIASAVLFLASDASAFATGTDIVLDGGYSLW
jgi:NAD(P)-dependent dehydrogenase (short-subunit alcohol dehydrogenase family)